MTISARLDEQLSQELDQAARIAGVSKSELIRQSVGRRVFERDD